MGILLKGTTPVFLLLLLLTILNSSCCGARTMGTLNARPAAAKNSSGAYLGLLPRAIPIPPSGPSKRHDSVGAQSHRSP
ncbi:Protein IDA-LIKE 2 [Ananas comosus]|uniref:Protein IDA-LIKE 2 n=1 Tax=Ananas comosus TaxID=4615 RepID=A0A199UXJ3_ANACO|nr:Protein IDA-LIKE 2 [Ananas comosus]OAY69494.1 Protein IDA-LIKE 2 [Ananas comosus]